MITQEQAERAIELLKEAPKILATAMMKTETETETEKVYGEWALKRKKLLQEIEANKPTNGDRIRAMTDDRRQAMKLKKHKCKYCKSELYCIAGWLICSGCGARWDTTKCEN